MRENNILKSLIQLFQNGFFFVEFQNDYYNIYKENLKSSNIKHFSFMFMIIDHKAST